MVVGVVLYGLAWLTSIGWFYVADSLVWALLLVNLPLPWLDVRGLSAQRRIRAGGSGGTADIFEDDAVTIAIEVRSRSFLPKFLVKLQEHCPLGYPEEEDQGFLMGAVGPRGHETASYQVRCYRRGVYSFGPLRLESSAPFGFFRARRRACCSQGKMSG